MLWLSAPDKVGYLSFSNSSISPPSNWYRHLALTRYPATSPDIPTMPQTGVEKKKRKRKKPQTIGFSGYIKLLRWPWKMDALFIIQWQHLCNWQKMHCFSPRECVQCGAAVVAINPNLTDTGSKSTFREPWKLTGENLVPCSWLTSKIRQWRLFRWEQHF